MTEPLRAALERIVAAIDWKDGYDTALGDDVDTLRAALAADTARPEVPATTSNPVQVARPARMTDPLQAALDEWDAIEGSGLAAEFRALLAAGKMADAIRVLAADTNQTSKVAAEARPGLDVERLRAIPGLQFHFVDANGQPYEPADQRDDEDLYQYVARLTEARP